MIIGNHEQKLEVHFVERTPHNLPRAGDVAVRISLRGEDLSAEVEGIWFDELAVTEFIRDSIRLRDSRDGIARLESMSPGNFILELRALWPSGRIQAALSLKWFRYFDYELVERSAKTALEVLSIDDLIHDTRRCLLTEPT